MITSTRNPKIQWVRALQGRARARRESLAFVIEGVRLAEEAVQSGRVPQLVLHTRDLSARGQAALESLRGLGAPVEPVSPHVMQSASETRTPQGLLAVLPLESAGTPPAHDFTLVLDQVRDPGNLGTLLRTAAAAGVGPVLLTPGTADAYAPKVVRAAAGAHFRLQLFDLPWDEIRLALSQPVGGQSLQIYAAEAGRGRPYLSVDFRDPLALILGGEAHGISQPARALRPIAVHIPMPGGGESLNVSVAAGILLFEITRQRAA